jgi:hypothetical protein
MPNCQFHPGRSSTFNLFGKSYCDACKTGIENAQKQVDRHVEPKECFIWYAKADDWEPIDGTGCAHWVSHQQGIKSGSAADKCLAGFTYRVKVMITGHKLIQEIKNVRRGDIYVTLKKDHTGLVTKVTKPKNESDAPTIKIKHDSSRQGRVSENDFATYFKGKGFFYR